MRRAAGEVRQGERGELRRAQRFAATGVATPGAGGLGLSTTGGRRTSSAAGTIRIVATIPTIIIAGRQS
jgi:hypothetical protein